MLSRTLRKGGSTGANHEAPVGITSVIAIIPETIDHRTTLMPSCSYAEFRLRTHNCTQSNRGWSIRHSLRISVLVLGLRSGRHHCRTARLLDGSGARELGLERAPRTNPSILGRADG
jgi:hypothetical protein